MEDPAFNSLLVKLNHAFEISLHIGSNVRYKLAIGEESSTVGGWRISGISL